MGKICTNYQASNLVAEAQDRGWKVKVLLVEMGYRGFVAAKLLSGGWNQGTGSQIDHQRDG